MKKRVGGLSLSCHRVSLYLCVHIYDCTVCIYMGGSCWCVSFVHSFSPFFFLLFWLADYTHAQMNTKRVHTEKIHHSTESGWLATMPPRWNDGPVSAPFRQGPKGKRIKGRDEKGKKKKKQDCSSFSHMAANACTQEDGAERAWRWFSSRRRNMKR